MSGHRADLRTQVGSVQLPNPVMTASGTAGYGTELSGYIDLGELGAVVVKSLAPFAWAGNPPPRIAEAPGGMINSVGLQGPGLEAWLDITLPELLEQTPRVILSVWGRRVEDFEACAAILSDREPNLLAVEVNLACPNLREHLELFAHSTSATSDAVAAVVATGYPVWAKLSPRVTHVVEIADAAATAGAETVVLVNNLMGTVIDIEQRAPKLGGVVGGLSGPALRAVAVRAVWECRRAHPELGIVGVGGVACGENAVEFLQAGADAVQVGTATFYDPRASIKVLHGLRRWCGDHSVLRVRELVGAAIP